MTTESTTEHNKNEIKAKITSKVFVYIRSINKSKPLGGPLYAINWFNTKRLWLYNFYNLIATGSVKRIGGAPFFKGKVQEVLFGDNQDRRDVLLVVKYPNAIQFKKLMESMYFKCVSIFRVLSVSRFTFGFTEPTSSQTTPSKLTENKVYTIHHYKADRDITKEIEQILKNQEVKLFYAGAISALLHTGDAQIAKQQTPCLMSGILILSADTVADHKNLIETQEYQAIIKTTESSFIATLERIL